MGTHAHARTRACTHENTHVHAHTLNSRFEALWWSWKNPLNIDGSYFYRQRSALSYLQNDSSLEGGLSRVNIGISTSSTTSRSTSKSGRGGLYHPEGYLHSSSTSTNPNAPYDYPPNAGIAPYGYDSAQYHSKPVKDGTCFWRTVFYLKQMMLV